MKPFRDEAELLTALESLRPTPGPAFAAALDERAAAGFPRRTPAGDSPFARLLAHLRALPPRRLVLPAGGVALAAIAIATAVVAVSGTTDERLVLSMDSADGVQPRSADSPGGSKLFEQSVPTIGNPSSASRSSGGGAAEAQHEIAVPNLAGTESGVRHRDVERAAEMVLGTEPADVDGAAAKVFDAVHTYNGIVLRSSIERNGGGSSGAEFDLLIPSAKLSDALAAFSRIGEVRMRHESTTDITAPTVSAGEHLRDSEARIDGLLAQLAEADTESEREAVEAELRTERRQAARMRAQLANLDRRASLSRVSLRIETGATSSSRGSGDEGSWGIGDALGDAGHILSIAAAVTLVGLAVLAPFALLALLAALAHQTWLRRHRERALG
jgi:hypothetical protein